MLTVVEGFHMRKGYLNVMVKAGWLCGDAALAEVRHLATREGWCYQHVQAITVAIDQYAAKAFGNREYIFTDR